MVIQENMSMEEKLSILSDAAKYDVACTSSGVDRKGKEGSIGSAFQSGICHTFTADGRCVSLLKILFTNECIFDCKYCINRSSNDVKRTTFTPDEVCNLTIEFYRRNYIEGLFLSSGILHSPNYTMDLIYQTLKKLRCEYHFNGYIHCKAIPGADPELIELAGWYADRMSVNLELPTADGLKHLAPHKSRKNILNPIRQIQSGIEESQEVLGMSGGNKGAYWHTRRKLEGKSIEQKRQEDAARYHLAKNNTNGVQGKEKQLTLDSSGILKKADMQKQDLQTTDMHGLNTHRSDMQKSRIILPGEGEESSLIQSSTTGLSCLSQFAGSRGFVPAGQSTQMIIGATPETDFELISVTEALYQKFDLKRVFYSAFIRVNDDSALPVIPGGPPLLREHRLYQADWLLRYYGFMAGELLTKERPNFNVYLDPKCNWALGHLEEFPVEINKADYYTLLRVPGIGPKSASRIVKARKMANLNFTDLKKLGVVLKRALYFITCDGRMMYPTKIEENYITRQLLNLNETLPKHITNGEMTYEQMSLFQIPNFSGAQSSSIVS